MGAAQAGRKHRQQNYNDGAHRHRDQARRKDNDGQRCLRHLIALVFPPCLLGDDAADKQQGDKDERSDDERWWKAKGGRC